jgi:hypothetical protein
VTISDGQSYSQAMLATQLNSLVTEKKVDLRSFALCHICWLSCAFTREAVLARRSRARVKCAENAFGVCDFRMSCSWRRIVSLK